MEIKPIVDQNEWIAFLRESAPHSFLQTWEWGEFNQKQGAKIFRLGLYENALVGICQTLLINARRGTFLFVPHGPLFKNFEESGFSALLAHLRALAKKHQADFIRISPGQTLDKNLLDLYQAHDFRPAPIHMHAELMWLLDIRPAAEALLLGMRKNCRAAIRRADKMGVEVRITRDPSELGQFMKLYEPTARRRRFVPFSKDYLAGEFEIFNKSGSAAILLGLHGGAVRSCAVIIFTQSEAFYHQGASVAADPVPVSHALQWAAILESKRRNCAYYNFWGVSPQDKTRHPWAGLSYFKRGFGGFELPYLHAQDLPLNNRYWLVWLLETIRRRKRQL